MAKALNTYTLSVQCPPEHLHVLSASVQGTGTSYSGARQGVFLCHKNRFVLQNALPPEGPPRRFSSKVASEFHTKSHLNESPPRKHPHQSRSGAKGDDERKVEGVMPFVHTKIGQTRGTFIPSVCPIAVRLHTASTRRAFDANS